MGTERTSFPWSEEVDRLWDQAEHFLDSRLRPGNQNSREALLRLRVHGWDIEVVGDVAANKSKIVLSDRASLNAVGWGKIICISPKDSQYAFPGVNVTVSAIREKKLKDESKKVDREWLSVGAKMVKDIVFEKSPEGDAVICLETAAGNRVIIPLRYSQHSEVSD